MKRYKRDDKPKRDEDEEDPKKDEEIPEVIQLWYWKKDENDDQNTDIARADGGDDNQKTAPKTDRTDKRLRRLNLQQCTRWTNARKNTNLKEVKENKPSIGKEAKQLKNKVNIKAGTLNLQGAWDTGPSGLASGKLDEVARYMDEVNLDLLALQGTKTTERRFQTKWLHTCLCT